MKLYALGGFLAEPGDWEGVAATVIDPYEVKEPSSDGGLWSWARAFNESIGEAEEKVLMGYSLGGRLALHALLDSPSKWGGAVFISCHPGLESPKERIVRGDNDRMWADRFLTLPWQDVMEKWNAQPCFYNSTTLVRQESSHCRERLADTLTSWSLANQENLIERIGLVDTPILWLVGASDHQFVALAKSLTFKNPLSQVLIIPNSGHRLIWDAPLLFKEAINQWMETLYRSCLKIEI